ncbi:MAG TPA: sugar phosphate nucleotidyltransferase [Verrucomicrobiales bacterium]|nr:sugar phosphate nucleotidyltransferase [Verrucomicrobiales bacterium]
MSETYAVILAGGSGTRFWPLSRDNRPKQLLQLFGEETLLQQALARLDGLVPRQNILILTNREQEEAVRNLLGDAVPAENIVAEPDKRDTAPAIALGIGWVAARSPDATMLVLPADQLIKDKAAFQECLRGAAEVAERTRALVTIGIKPTWACPSYGYIERGRRAFISGLSYSPAVYEVHKFREKPAPDLAEQFIQQGNFSWNAGMFIWTVSGVIAELSQHCPELAAFVREIRQSRNLPATLASQFPGLPRISIDYALMEKAGRVLNVEASFDWDDVGSWISVGKYLATDETKNASNSPLSVIDADNNIVFTTGGQRVALLGVEDLIVVQTPDALLIADRHSADAIKKLVELVPKELR